MQKINKNTIILKKITITLWVCMLSTMIVITHLYFVFYYNSCSFSNKFLKLLDTINNINHFIMTEHEKQIKILITWKCIQNIIYFNCYFYFFTMRYLAIINHSKVIIKWYLNGHFNTSPRIISFSCNDMNQKSSRWPSSGLDLKIIVRRYSYKYKKSPFWCAYMRLLETTS